MRKLTILFLALILFTSCGETEVDSSKLVERGGLTYEVNSETLFTGVSVNKHENGQIESSITYKVGKEIYRSEYHYHENGQLWMKASYRGRDSLTGKLEGPNESYLENGQLILRENFKNGERDGPYESYYYNGQLEFKGTFKDGKGDGPYEFYYENGQLEGEGIFKDGKREGPWVFYTEDGEKRLIPQKSKDGRTIDEGSGTYKNDKKISD